MVFSKIFLSIFTFTLRGNILQPCVSQKQFPPIDETADLQNAETKALNIQGLKKFINASNGNTIILLQKWVPFKDT